LFLAGTGCAVALGGVGPGDGAQIARTGRATLGLLKSSRASWVIELRPPVGPAVQAEVLWTPDKSRWRFWVDAGGRRSDLFELITHEDRWHASEAGKPLGKYRPYEAPFSLPTAYRFFGLAEARFVTDAGMLAAARYTGRDSVGASYRVPLSADDARTLREALGGLEKLAEAARDGAARAAARRQIDQLRETLELGLLLRVDTATGLLLHRDEADFTVVLKEFKWLQRVDAAAFDVSAATWDDHSADPTQGADPNDLAMINRNGAWRPGTPAGDLDCCLIHVKTGRFRRVPFRGVVAGAGCFLSGRTRVVVSGVESPDSGMGLWQLDLRTGHNRRLGGELLRTGVCLVPVLSPDGKTLAVLHHGGAAEPDSPAAALQRQVCLVDVDSGRARKLGEPLDAGCLSWLPDGKGLLLVRRKRLERGQPPVSTIARMDLTGRTSPLRPGEAPVVLGDGRVLFRDPRGGGLWKTCDLAGKDVRLFADGLKGYGFPSPSPEGRRILWIQFRQKEGPRPVIIEIGSTEATPVTDAAGLWAWPTWR
jgi:hypothetical protein